MKNFAQDPKIQQQEKTEKKDPIIEQQRNLQIKTTKILEQLLNAENMDQEAEKIRKQFDPEFFQQTAAFIELARKDPDQSPLQNLLRCYRVAQTAMNKNLPPQIQLINQCLWSKKNTLKNLLEDNEQVLWLENEKFFKTLDRMIVDFDKRKMFTEANKLREAKKIANSMRDIKK